jgi:AMP-binding enzyme C-terminal domain
MATSKANGILARLTELESSQKTLMTSLAASHDAEREALRARIAAANARRDSLTHSSANMAIMPAPVLMEFNMSEVDAAVQAAARAEHESSDALQDALSVAAAAKAGRDPNAPLALPAPEETVGYGDDGEFIVKQVNVNLDDVERVMNNSPLVEVCRAFGRPDSKYGNEVYCCVVPKRNVRVSEQMLLLYAAKYLSSSLAPKRIYFSETLSDVTRQSLAEGDLNSLAPSLPSNTQTHPTGLFF